MWNISEAVRGLSLDPKNTSEKLHRREAEGELRLDLDAIQSDFRSDAELSASVRNLRDFALSTNTLGTLGYFQGQVMGMAETHPAAAADHYNKNYPAISRQRDQLFGDLSKQADRIKNAESERAQTVAIVGLAYIPVFCLASLLVGRFQSSAVARPLNRLVAALERMRQGDFTERLALERKDEFGVLGEGLNRLADDLSGLVGQVQRSGIQVNTTATEIAATAKEQQSTAHEIAATTAEIGATSKEISATSKGTGQDDERSQPGRRGDRQPGRQRPDGHRPHGSHHAPDHGGLRLDHRQTRGAERKDHQHQLRRHHHHQSRRPNQPAVAQRGHRGRESRRIRPGLCRGGDGNPPSGRPDRRGHL